MTIVMEQSSSSQMRAFSTSRVAVIIPAYNEERFIGSVVLKSRQYSDNVIVVDDGSSDQTAAVAATAGAYVIEHHINQGKGGALNTGFAYAQDIGADVIVTIDADGQHDVEEISAVIDPVINGDADLVIGSRYLVNNSDVPPHRVIGHKAFNFITNQASGTSVTDSQSGFRAFSPRCLSKLAFSSNGFSVESEMQFIAREHALKLVEVPITIYYHDAPKRSVWAHGLTVLNGILRLVGQYRPLLFFGLVGICMLILGLGWGLWVIDLFRQTRELATGYALISALLFIIGNIALSTGIILHSVRGLLLNIPQRTV
ncbi:MAG: glycosyltransferase family 2 protein [Chloroflexi bacterium]|nr:glycosyltransferase family 2 protein [Chloroflexota bacterium]